MGCGSWLILYNLVILPLLCHSAKVIWSVNAGGEAFTDSFGIYYNRDTLKTGTASDYGKALTIQRVPQGDMTLYQTERYHEGTFGYDIPIKAEGDYVLVLKFSEVWFNGARQKVFDVIINGLHVAVEGLDIFATVGRGVAHDEVVPFRITKDTLNVAGESSHYDGTLTVEFIKGTQDNPKINAMYVMLGTEKDVPQLPDIKEPTLPEEEEEEGEEKEFPREKPTEAKRKDTRKKHVSGAKTTDPYQQLDWSQSLLPIVASLVAIIPVVLCLCKL